MKKILALVLALMLLVPSAMAAEQLADYYKPPKMTEGQYPIAGENLTLTYWMPINAGAANFIPSYDENPSYQLIQQNTGVDIQFIHPAAGTETEAFQLMLAGDLPDMILMSKGSWYTGDLAAMYEDGIIIDLLPYLDEYAPQYKSVIDHSELAQAQCYADGKVLGFYKVTHADKMPYVRVNTNKDWLTEMGVAEPKTIAEYEAYFDWILKNKEGVTPIFIGTFTNTGSMEMNLFTGAFDFLYSWYVTKEDATKAAYWANAPEYKEYLTLMNSWYNKGYLGKDFMGMTITEAQAQFDAGKIGCIVDSVDATYSRVQESGKLFNVTNLPYMRKEADSVLGSGLAATPVGDGGEWVTVVTSACKNPELAIQYLNYGYTYEGSLIFTFGVEGIHWNWGEDGLPKFTDEILHNPKGMTISNVSYALKIHFGAKYCYPDDIGHPGTASNTTALRIRTMWKGDTNEQNWLQLPPVKLTAEESAERSELMAQVNTYAKEMMIKFITGAEPLENFEAYVEEVNEYGLTEAIEITQGALDRFLGK